MLEIYLMTSLGAIPIATMQIKEWNMGQNYLKAQLALAFQGFLIMVYVGIHAVLIHSEVARIAGDVGKTPSQWNGGVFSLAEITK